MFKTICVLLVSFVVLYLYFWRKRHIELIIENLTDFDVELTITSNSKLLYTIRSGKQFAFNTVFVPRGVEISASYNKNHISSEVFLQQKENLAWILTCDEGVYKGLVTWIDAA